MTPEEQKLLTDLFDRVHAAGAAARDPQAQSFIDDAVRALPHAPYVLAQTVLIQTQALEAASRRIAELQSTAQAAQPQAETSFLGNLGKSLFGAAAPPPRSSYDASAYQRGAPAPPPPQQYAAPQPQPPQPQQSYAPPSAGPWGAAAPSSGGFLHNAVSTAAGVAGGIALGNIVGGLFGGHGGGLFGGSGGGMFGGGGFLPGGETVNNFYDTGQDGANLHEMDHIQDQQQDALDDADAQQDAYQDASDDGGDNSSFDDGGSQDV